MDKYLHWKSNFHFSQLELNQNYAVLYSISQLDLLI